jgi:hypothetical protein
VRTARVRLLLTAAFLAPVLLLPGAAGAATGPGPVWEMASSSEGNLAQADPGLAAADLNQAGVLLQKSAPVDSSPVPAGWAAVPEERWASEAQFAADLSSGSVPGYIQVAHYDNEKWAATPLAEQQDPDAYERLFCQAAHAAGLECATGPARDICPVAYPGSGTSSQCYLAHDLAGGAAAFADYTDIQAQVLEGDTVAYQSFVSQAAAQARAANPFATVLANLSPTAVAGVTAQQLAADLAAVCPLAVAGSYWTVTSAGAAVADQALALAEPSGPSSTAC